MMIFNTTMDANGTGLGEASDASKATICADANRFYINSVVAGGLCVFGFIGNIVSFCVLRRDNESVVGSLLLRALAVSDTIFLGIWFTHFSLRDLFNYLDFRDNHNLFWMYTRLYTYPLLFIGQMGTIWMTVLIALSRYLSVCHPYRAIAWNKRPMVSRGIFAVACFSVCYNSPRYFEVYLAPIVSNTSFMQRYTFARTPFGDSKWYMVGYFDVMYYIFSFALPLVLLLVLSSKLIVAYRALQRRRRRNSNASGHCDQNITLVMIVIIVVFMVCNAPPRLVQMLLQYRIQVCPSLEFIVMEISNVLEVLNSSVNFIIYCVCRKKFRQYLWNCNGALQPAGPKELSGMPRTRTTSYTALWLTDFATKFN